MTKDIWGDLAVPFPKSAVSWRAQTVTKNGDKALALAYVDARDVRQRLNEVVGHANWKCHHYDCGNGRLACELSIRIDGEWISKTDGAGDTQVEAEKGAFSGALKRAAVAFGVGEYLYDMPNVWVPCDSYQRGDKWVWTAWKDDPWKYVRAPDMATEAPKPPPQKPKGLTVAARKAMWAQLMDDLKGEAPKGWQKMVAYMQHPDTLVAIEDLGDYKEQFLSEARELTKLAKAGEEAAGEPVAKAMSRVMPNFDSLDTEPTPDALDGILEDVRFEQERGAEAARQDNKEHSNGK